MIKRNFSIVVIVVCSSLLFAGSQRKGWFIGASAGTGMVKSAGRVDSLGTHVSIDHGFKSHFGMEIVKFGYAPVNKLQISVGLPGKFALFQGADGIVRSTGILFPCGMRYYQKQTAPSPFIATGIGIAAYGREEDMFDSDIEAEETFGGFGWYSGIGYEIKTHWSMMLEFAQGNAHENKTSSGIIASNNFWVLSLSLEYLIY